MSNQPIDDMPAEVDFSKGVRGLHHIPPGAKVFLPSTVERGVSAAPVSAQKVLNYIVNDFEAAWAALSATPDAPGRGNFMFALLSMILLEFACRVCAKDSKSKKLANFTDALREIEPRYFTELPGDWGKTSEFTLPGSNPSRHLLGMIFDLVRNGKAHQYQSPIVKLSDGCVDIDLTGAEPGRELTKPGRCRPASHLGYKLSSSGDASLYVRTDQLFLDIKHAIESSGIISGSEPVTDISRPRPSKPSKRNGAPRYYAFTLSDFKTCLDNAGHNRTQ